MFKNITRTVWLLSILSLFNDFSSEMLYPIIPLYLQQIGYGSLLIGILEGIAECIAGLTKIYMGSISDSMQKRLPFVQVGYFLSVCSRPLIGISSSIGLIFAGRSIDKIGKGIRTASRDALLADESNASNAAEVFGFHRSMDTIGAVLGPLTAILYLHYHPENYKSLFFITLLPGIAAILCGFGLKEKQHVIGIHKSISWKQRFTYYRIAPKKYLRFILVLLCFSLINSSDMFLLLKAKENGCTEQHVLFLYILFNLSFAIFSFPIGKLADKVGKHWMFFIGLLLFAFCYYLIGQYTSSSLLFLSFILYGLFYACTHGISKAILLQTIEPNQKASAIGFYEGMNSFCLLIANSVAGFVWYTFGSSALLLTTSLFTIIIASIYLVTLIKRKNIKVIIFIGIAVLMSLHLKAQSVKDGIIYDTLTTIENEDFIVSEAVMLIKGEHEIFGVEIEARALAKRDVNILITKIWSGCHLCDEVLASKYWGGIRYTEYKMNSGINFRMGIAGEYKFN